MMLWLLLGVAAVLALWFVATYNGFIRLRLGVDTAWSDISVQLKRRYDLIPNLVETVKGYAAHEQGVFQSVTEARARAMQATTPQEKGQADASLTGTLKSLFAIAENYPQLRANENFMGLQTSLTAIETDVQNARRYYNAVVRDYNTKCHVFPDQLIARLGRFAPREFFQLEASQEARAPRVTLP